MPGIQERMIRAAKLDAQLYEAATWLREASAESWY
jgi:hypothetical protein